jgi:hypothetical protein
VVARIHDHTQPKENGVEEVTRNSVQAGVILGCIGKQGNLLGQRTNQPETCSEARGYEGNKPDMDLGCVLQLKRQPVFGPYQKYVLTICASDHGLV